MNRNELYHDGVIGMKWGIRRYQNKDGTLTELGKRRYSRDNKGDENYSSKTSEMLKQDAKRWVREDNQRGARLADAGVQGMRTAKEMNDKIAKDRSSPKMDLSSMTDAQLREAVNRANLEQQYMNAYGPSTVGKGQQRVGKILEYGGATLAVVGSALSIALAIRELAD